MPQIGGYSIYRNLDLDPTGVVVKATAGRLYGWWIANANASARFVKLYNKATAAAETDTPVMTLRIPGATSESEEFQGGISFATGISARATTGVADNDTGDPTANDIVVNLLYK